MSIHTGMRRQLSSFDDMINQLKQEMKEVTCRSLGPWYPDGGVFGISYEALPDDIVGEPAGAITNALNGHAGMRIDRIAIEGNVIRVFVEKPASLT